MAGIKILGSSTGQKIPILKVINHPDFSQDCFNDIAILKLAKPLRFNLNVQPACLPDFEPKPNSGAWVSGWGFPHTLKFAFVKIISKDQFQCNHPVQIEGFFKCVTCETLGYMGWFL